MMNLNEDELAKEFAAQLEKPPSMPKAPPFKMVDKADQKKDVDKPRAKQMLGQMTEIIAGLTTEIAGLLDQRRTINQKIMDTRAALIASEAAAEVLSLVDSDIARD